MTYDVIAELDPDVLSLFKINAELESEIDRTPESCLHYAQLIATLARNDRLRPLSAGAVTRARGGARRADSLERCADSLLVPGGAIRVRDAALAARHTGFRAVILWRRGR
ncbi:AAA family ATPase [Cupriavidus sp. AcVe19-1a]|nr:AAA family ATPase [Cupriavidus sp. AcVe19-1a]